MREILFKAKRIDNGKWIEGYYQKRYGMCGEIEHYIFWTQSYTIWEYAEVDPETLCQYTGLKDKDGNRIWENDIVEVKKKSFAIILWDEIKATFVIRKNGWLYDHFFSEGIDPEDANVCGNYFDNQELLERRE